MHSSLGVGVMTEMLIFMGSLDDLRVYDSALGGQEILQIFAGDDLEENLVQHQFDLLADGDPTEFSVSGLPLGLNWIRLPVKFSDFLRKLVFLI